MIYYRVGNKSLPKPRRFVVPDKQARQDAHVKVTELANVCRRLGDLDRSIVVMQDSGVINTDEFLQALLAGAQADHHDTDAQRKELMKWLNSFISSCNDTP